MKNNFMVDQFTNDYNTDLFNEDQYLCLGNEKYYLTVIDDEDHYFSEESLCNRDY